jgi:lysophospholipase L1-like esterase
VLIPPARTPSRLLTPLAIAALWAVATVPAGAQAPAGAPDPALPTLFYIGDSTVRNGSGEGANGEWGWGDLTHPYFDPARVTVVNRALGGRSSRTYLTQGHWDRVLSELKPGDVVIVQFGHNDGGALNDTSRARGTLRGVGEESEAIDNLLTGQHEVVRTFGGYLRRYIADTRARGATPVVASLVPRNIWENGTVVRNRNDYAGWAEQVARAEGVAFIDLNEIIAREYDALGPDRVREFFERDHTHTNRAGAMLSARLVIAALNALPDNPVRQFLSSAASAAQHPVVVDASRFLDEIQKGHVITDAATLGVPWLFNNTGLEMRTRSNYVLPVQIPEPGSYHLFVRSHGRQGSGFRVAVGDRVIERDVGTGPVALEWVGTFELDAGTVDVRLMRIEGSPVLDVLALSRDRSIGDDDLRPLQLHRDVRVLREYSIPRSSVVKFGDLTGDGRTDFVVLTPGYSAHAFDHDGRELWTWTAPEEGERLRAEFEAPGVVWDFDQDGFAEVAHWRQEGNREWLVIADGRTGEVKHRAPWPTRALPHVYNNFRLAVARLRPGYPSDLVVLTDSGDTISIAAYDARLAQLWNNVSALKKDHLGHFIYPRDLTGDGIDEVVVGDLVLDARGRELWNRMDLFFDHHDHVDSYRFADLTGNGRPELISAHSEVGVVVYDAPTGRIVWQHTAEHAQQVEAGPFLDGVAGPQVAIGARTYGNRQAGEPYLSAQVWWFDSGGSLLSKWPGMPLNGNPVFVKGDWRGDGREELFWHKFRMRGDGRGELFFGEGVFHMFDFTGDHAEEVITLERGVLRVYGYSGADHDAPRSPRTPDYLRHSVANHTHY